MTDHPPRDTGHRGFSLIELLIGVALISIMSAMAIPGIARYIKNYQIRAAGQQVATEIQTARLKAVMKNVNLGVVFVVLSPTTYQWIVEDDMNPAGGFLSTRVALNLLQPDPMQAGLVRTLPTGTQFGAGCVGFAGNDSGFRFNRLGAWCDPTGATGSCPALGLGQANAVMNGVGGATVCIVQPQTQLTASLLVSTGGRVVQP